MTRSTLLLAAMAALLTLGSFAAWLGTGRHMFTKYQAPVEAEEDPLLAGTGFYDHDGGQGVVELRDEFHFGLLPASALGKDAVAVLSVSAPAWGLVLLAFLLGRRRNLDQKEKRS